jgi:hypothetical protein
MKKTLCLILALVMILSVALVGCQGETETKTGGGAPSTAPVQDQNDVFDAPIKKLNREFTIIRRDTSAKHLTCNEVWADKVTGDKINDAVYSRNSKLQEIYGITVKDVPCGDISSTYKVALTSGDYVGDVMLHTLNHLKGFANAALLVAWSSLDNIDLNKNWWNSNCANGITIGDKSFFINGDGATLDDRATWAMFFNKTLVSNAQLQSPYELVESGDWTVTKMLEYMNALSEDKNDDGKVTFASNQDIVGYAGETYNNYVHMAAGNITLGNIAADGTITIPDDPKREVQDAWAALKPLLTSPNRYVESGSANFQNNLVAFCGVNLGVIINFPDSGVDFGVLPFPKLTKEQDGYYTAPSFAQLAIFALPRTVENDEKKDWEANGFSSASEQVAYMMEAFAYLSRDTVTPAFFEQVLAKQSVRDTESVKNLERILDKDHIVYDVVALMNFGSIGYTLFTGRNTAKQMANDLKYDEFTSTYQSRVEGARTALEEYLLIQELT